MKIGRANPSMTPRPRTAGTRGVRAPIEVEERPAEPEESTEPGDETEGADREAPPAADVVEEVTADLALAETDPKRRRTSISDVYDELNDEEPSGELDVVY